MKRFVAILLLIFTLFLVACDGEFDGDEFEPTAPIEDASDSDSDATGDNETEDNRKTYTVTYVDAEGGKIEGKLVQSIKEGDSGTVVKAVADKGYEFVEWSDGYKVATRSEYKVKNDITVSPVFKKKLGLMDVPATLDAPVIHIYTENGAPIVDKENYVTCTVNVSNTDEAACMEQVAAGIRGRGNSSWMHHDKKSYRIKFDKKQSMFGSEYKAKSWTLIANHADRTLSRNALAYEMAERFTDIAFSSMHQHVELYLNDEYQGLYLLCDQMQTGTGRVDIDEEMTGDPEEMGYLIEMDGRHHEEGTEGWDYFKLNTPLDHGKEYGLKTPDPDDAGYDPDIYLAYVENYITDCLEALSAQDWATINELMDVNSFADVYIIQELFANFDCATYSFYFYKEKAGKLYCGPVWDFDLSVGNGHYGAGDDYSYEPDSDIIKDGEMIVANTNTWFRRLLRIQEFRDIVKQKLQNYDETILSVINLADVHNLDGYYAKYQYSMNRNFVRWDILGKPVWPNPESVYSIPTIEGHFEYVRSWLLERYGLIKTEFEIT